jgi:hypothetical protein
MRILSWGSFGGRKSEVLRSYTSHKTARRSASDDNFRLADHPGASGVSRQKVKSTLFSAPGTKRSHLGTAHRKVLDSDYLEVSHASQFLILNCPLRQIRA